MDKQTLTDILRNGKGCCFASLEYVSVVKLPKKLGLGTVTKRCATKYALIGFEYERNVNRHLAANGLKDDFKAEQLPWGTWEVVNKAISHNGEMYLRYYVGKQSETSVEYFVDGKPANDVDIDTIKGYEASRSKGSKKQEAHGLEEEEQVKPRCVAYSNISELKVYGSVWVPDVQTDAAAA